MPFSNACFISYCHGQEDLVRTFIQEFTRALQAELDAYLDPKVFLDQTRLQGGDFYNEVLASAICESVCMIVIYYPKYEDHPYCLREYEGMRQLERARLPLLANARRGLIIPVVVRGLSYLPSEIKTTRQYYDFSGYNLVSPGLINNPAYATQIREIAETIFAFYRDLRAVVPDPCAACQGFTLPPLEGITAWHAGSQGSEAPFPLRGPA